MATFGAPLSIGNDCQNAVNAALEIVGEDEAIIVINKPPGMVVHPAAGHHSGTMVNALMGRYENLPTQSKKDESSRPGIVHRLDKDTSGIIVVAKTEESMTDLGRLFHDHIIDREYEAIVWGSLPDEGTIDAPLARHPGDRKRYAVVDGGKRAVTHWKVIESFEFMSRIAVTLETGRTHQIRVHMSSKGWPILADSIYGGGLHGLARLNSYARARGREALAMMNRQALHARLLGFVHPATAEHVIFEKDPPEDIQRVIEFLRSS